jgi:hypothetical protein
MENLPAYVAPIFIGVCVTVYGFLLYAFYWAVNGRRNPLTYISSGMLALLLFTGALAFNGFFQDFDSNPPRLVLIIVPLFIILITLLIVPQSRRALMKIPVTTLTYIHIVRIPVELCLWWLFGAGLVAKEMTFEGANFDIIAGISAPFAGVFLVGKKSRNRLAAIIWHLICLSLVLNIVIRAMALTPYFYDGSGSELQNLAVFEFPFIWLPTFVVPAVIFSHLIALLILLKKPE